MTDDSSRSPAHNHMCFARRRCLPFRKQNLEGVWALAATSKDIMGTLELQTTTREEMAPFLAGVVGDSCSVSFLFGSKTNESVSSTNLTRARAKHRDMCANTHQEMYGSGCRPLHSNSIVTKFWMLAILVNAPPAATQRAGARARAKRQLIHRHFCFKLLLCWTWTVGWARWKTVPASSWSFMRRIAKTGATGTRVMEEPGEGAEGRGSGGTRRCTNSWRERRSWRPGGSPYGLCFADCGAQDDARAGGLPEQRGSNVSTILAQQSDWERSIVRVQPWHQQPREGRAWIFAYRKRRNSCLSGAGKSSLPWCTATTVQRSNSSDNASTYRDLLEGTTVVWMCNSSTGMETLVTKKPGTHLNGNHDDDAVPAPWEPCGWLHVPGSAAPEVLWPQAPGPWAPFYAPLPPTPIRPFTFSTRWC